MCKKIYRALAKAVAKEMVAELEANQHKGDRKVWVNMNITDLMNDLRYHVEKLDKAILDKNGDRVREYAADVCNIAGFIMDKHGLVKELDEIERTNNEKIRNSYVPKSDSSWS